MATVNPIAPDELRPFLSSGEGLCRPVSAPEIASLHFNAAAPNSSLIALGIARAGGAIGITEVVMEQGLPQHVVGALELARDAIEEMQLILNELQRRDTLQRNGGLQ